MRKVLFISLLSAVLFSCSTDDSQLTTPEDAIDNNTVAYIFQEKSGKDFTDVPDCDFDLNATFAIDYSDGLNNPTLKFGAKIPYTYFSTYPFTLELHLQPLADCEDMNSENGAPTIITPYSLTQLNNIPTINLKPYQIPYMCYKWKMVLRSNKKQGNCVESTAWQDAPLY